MSSRLITASRAALITELQGLLGDRCTINATELETHSHSESWHPAGVPDVVVYPLSTEEVSAVLRIAARVGAPVVPFGAGSSLEGHVNAFSPRQSRHNPTGVHRRTLGGRHSNQLREVDFYRNEVVSREKNHGASSVLVLSGAVG